MRILLISHGFYPLDAAGGMELFTSEMANLLSAEHKVTVLVFTYDRSQGRSVISRQKIDEIEIVHAPGAKESKPHPGFTAAQFRQFLQAEQPDLIYIVSPYLLPFQLMDEAAELGIPWIVHLNDFYLVCPRIKLLRKSGRLCSGPKRWRCTRCLKKISRPVSFFGSAARFSRNMTGALAVIQRAGAVLCDSLHVARTYMKYGLAAEQVVNAPPILNQEIHPRLKGQSNDFLKIGFFGGPSYAKGIHILADAVKQVKCPWRLSIYNVERDKQARVLKLFKGVENRVTLHDALCPDELDTVFADIDVLSVPSVWPEAYGRVIDEALIREVIVVASNTGGMAERLVDGLNALLTPAGDSAALAEKFSYIFNHLGNLRGSMKFDFRLPQMKSYNEKLKKICIAVAQKQPTNGFFLDHELEIPAICEVTGESRENVERRLLGELRNPGSTVNAAWIDAGQPKNKPDIDAFYKSNDAYLYDLVVAHSTWERQLWCTTSLSRLIKLGCKNVLDYGAGIGHDSILFSAAGLVVTHYDPNEYCRKFAEILSKSMGQKLSIISSPDSLPDGAFEAIYCTGILEHIPDPKTELERMRRLLKTGGYLLTTDSNGSNSDRTLTYLSLNAASSDKFGRLADKTGLSIREVITVPGNKVYALERV